MKARPPARPTSRGRRATLRRGDVLSCRFSEGTALVQYVGRHPFLGDCIRMSPRWHRRVPADLERAFRDAYLTFYPLRFAMRSGLWTVVGALEAPPVPTSTRRGLSLTTEVRHWLIRSPEGEERKESAALTAEERRMPIEANLGHEGLRDYVASGWRPESDVFRLGPWDARAETGSRTASASSAPPPTGVRHFLYFASRRAADAAAKALPGDRFAVSVGRSVGPRPWSLQIVVSSADAVRQLPADRRRLEALARRWKGEYDGWEVPY